MTRDKEINNILNRAEKYREQFHKEDEPKNTSPVDMDIDLGKLFNDFFENHKLDAESENNVYVKCKLTKEEIKNGCTKNIKYKFLDEKGNKKSTSISVNIPKQISSGQKIVISASGNYVPKDRIFSNLVITVETKHGICRKN